MKIHMLNQITLFNGVEWSTVSAISQYDKCTAVEWFVQISCCCFCNLSSFAQVGSAVHIEGIMDEECGRKMAGFHLSKHLNAAKMGFGHWQRCVVAICHLSEILIFIAECSDILRKTQFSDSRKLEWNWHREKRRGTVERGNDWPFL